MGFGEVGNAKAENINGDFEGTPSEYVFGYRKSEENRTIDTHG